MKETLTVVTRKGQITLPVEVRRRLGIQEGDKVSISLRDGAEGEQPQVVLKPVRSVAEMTFGMVPPRQHPVDLDRMRRLFEEGMVEETTADLESDASDEQE